MNKIALCLSGYFDSFTDKTSKGIDGYKYIQKKILSLSNEVDIYIHSWDINKQSKIEQLYNPKNFIFEKQINFSSNEIANFKDEQKDRIIDANRILSQSYGVSKSIELACKSSTKYDIIIRSRFDLGRINRLHAGRPFITFKPFSINRNFWRNKYPVQCIEFNPSLDMSYYYFAYWNNNHHGPADMWWYSSHDNMSKFSDFFNYANKQLKIGSKFLSKFKKPSYIDLLNDFMIQYNILEKCKYLKTKWE